MNPFRLCLAVLVMVLVTGTVVTQSHPAVAATSVEPRSWAPEWMVRHQGQYTEAEARDIARRYDVVVAHPNTFATLVDVMKRENPEVKILTYVNGPFAAKWLPDYPESWYAHDAGWKRVRSVQFGSYLMNLHLPEWRREVLRICDDMLATSGYDGCFLDSLGNGLVKNGALDRVPIDPRTGQAWDPARYIKDTASIAAFVRGQRPDIMVTANGLASGGPYFDSGLGVLADSVDLGMAEWWMRAPAAPIDDWPSVRQWTDSVNMVADAERRGSGVMTVVKIWTPANEAQRRQWYDFTLGSFLLGSDGASRFFFLKDGCLPPCTDGASSLASQWTPELTLGSPRGAYQARGGAYVREFANGWVAVNPQEAAVTVTPPSGSYRDQDGTAVTGTLVLGSHRSVVLTRAGATSPPPPPPPPDATPRPPEVMIGLAPGTGLTTGPTTTAGLAIDESAVTRVKVTIRNVDNGKWLQRDGSWGGSSQTLLADLDSPGTATTGWKYRWVVPQGSFVLSARAVDDASNVSSLATTLFTAAPGDAVASVTCRGLPATIVGTPGDDLILGTSGRDVIAGRSGNDRIWGLAGDDVICGGPGDDKLLGNAGYDRFGGGSGTDRCSGGNGHDLAVACEQMRWMEGRG